MDMNSLAHTKWECKYHIVFAPKFRRKVIYGQIKADVGNILSMLCKRKGIEIIEAECMPDHVHMFVRIPPKYSVSQIVGYLKGKSSLMIIERSLPHIPLEKLTETGSITKAKPGSNIPYRRFCGTQQGTGFHDQ